MRKKIVELKGNTIGGLIAIMLFGIFSMYIARATFITSLGLNALTVAIIIGICLGNILPGISSNGTATAFNFTKSFFLRGGIILYGVRLTFSDLHELGWAGVLIPLSVVILVIVVGLFIGKRLFKLNTAYAMLISVGSAVCGATAILASAPVLKASSKNTTVAIATVTFYSMIGLFLYPIIHHFLLLHWNISFRAFGIFTGSTVHETAQVIATAKTIGEDVEHFAIITKMVRVLALVPLLITIAIYNREADDDIANAKKHNVTHRRNALKQFFVLGYEVMPWFALCMFAVVIINSTGVIPKNIIPTIQTFGTGLLTSAMFSIGVQTRLKAFWESGLKAILFAGVLFLLLIFGGGGICILIEKLFA